MEVITAPKGSGISKSILMPIAAPNISAKAVEIDANIAVVNINLPVVLLKYLEIDSDKHSPVTIPRWAALCCKNTSIIVERVTIHRREYPNLEPAAILEAQFPGSINPTVTKNPGPIYFNISNAPSFGECFLSIFIDDLSKYY
jgi:hypothetical protein